MKLMIEISDVEMNRLRLFALQRGFPRVASQTGWTEKEKKEVCRFGIQLLMDEGLK